MIFNPGSSGERTASVSLRTRWGVTVLAATAFGAAAFTWYVSTANPDSSGGTVLLWQALQLSLMAIAVLAGFWFNAAAQENPISTPARATRGGFAFLHILSGALIAALVLGAENLAIFATLTENPAARAGSLGFILSTVWLSAMVYRDLPGRAPRSRLGSGRSPAGRESAPRG